MDAHLLKKGYEASFEGEGAWTFRRKNVTVRFEEGLPFVKVGQITVRLARPLFERGGSLDLAPGDFAQVTNLVSRAERQFQRRAETNAEPIPAASAPEVVRSRPSSKIDFIFLDPGHGGADPGAGMYGFQEKDLALLVSKDLSAALTNRLASTEVVLLRSKDEYLSLEDRCRIANEKLGRSRNGVFVSVHLNTWPFDASARGFEIYYMAHQDWSERARMVAMTENKAFLPERTNTAALGIWQRIFSRLESAQYQKESKRIAETVSFQVFRRLKDYAVNRGVKAETFWVLKGALMPSVLIEVGFLSSREDLEYLNDETKRKELVAAIAEGLEQYVRDFDKSGGFTEDLF